MTRTVPGQEVERLWPQLGDEDARKACRALSGLIRRPRATTKLIRRQLRCGEPSDARYVGRLIAELDSNSFPVRQAASTRIGPTRSPPR